MHNFSEVSMKTMYTDNTSRKGFRKPYRNSYFNWAIFEHLTVHNFSKEMW